MRFCLHLERNSSVTHCLFVGSRTVSNNICTQNAYVSAYISNETRALLTAYLLEAELFLTTFVHKMHAFLPTSRMKLERYSLPICWKQNYV